MARDVTEEVPRPVPGLTPADILALWSADGLSALVYRRGELPYRLEASISQPGAGRCSKSSRRWTALDSFP